MDIAQFQQRHVVRYAPTALAGADQTGLAFTYVERAPGERLDVEAAAGWTMIVPMSGRWRIGPDGDPDVVLGRWDTLVVPEARGYRATNVGDEVAVMMTIHRQPSQEEPS